ncbi:MAG: hypothetical protein LC128_14705 [Chitinophagales bacterium]|nr:hypothetical protein [Chitinophagales bacterium]
MQNIRPLLPVFFLFLMINVLIIGERLLFKEWEIGGKVLISGNLLLFIVTLISFRLGQQGLKSDNVQAFVRSIYLSFIIKFFVVAIAAFIYIMMKKKEVNKTAIVIFMCLYLVYSFFEVSLLMKMSKVKKNG